MGSIQEVIKRMQQLNQELTDSDLHNLTYFNTTYLIITQAVAVKFNTSYFDSNQKMEQFDIIFAKYYFDALEHYQKGEYCAPAWQLCFDACKHKKLFSWQYMALGINAHVNNDLAFSLQTFNPNQNYLNDFNRINKVISHSLLTVFQNLKDPPPFNLAYNSIGVTLSRPILDLIITQWRNQAWQNYQKLQPQLITPSQIEQHAKHIANWLGGR